MSCHGENTTSNNTTTPSPCVSPSGSSSSSSRSSSSSLVVTGNNDASPGSNSSQGNTHRGGESKNYFSCNCPTSLHSYNESYRVCPVCLTKFDPDARVPVALTCGHTICVQCARLLLPGINDGVNATDENSGTSGSTGSSSGGSASDPRINSNVGVVNYPLLWFLDYSCNPEVSVEEEPIVELLCRIARLIRGNTVSRSVHRKTIVLINSITPDYTKIWKCAKGLGERCVIELTSSCAHVSHYHAQQQLWAAIRARACQFLGPAMQDEALRLVLLALEDGSALSRKVLVMFVVQRLAPQFPQASKTSVGHIVQLLYRASAFNVLKQPGNSSLMTLRPEFRNYEALRREHDTQIMKIGLEAGIRFTPEQWSSLLYGDTGQKPLMQSIIDKLQSPQTFQELLKEYLVSVQRLSDPDSQFLVSLHPHFKVLANLDVDARADSPGTGSPGGQVSLPQMLESLHSVLVGLISFTANRKHQRSARSDQQQQNRTPATTTPTANTAPPSTNPASTSLKPQQYSNNCVRAAGGVLFAHGATPTDAGAPDPGALVQEHLNGAVVNNNLVGIIHANLCI